MIQIYTKNSCPFCDKTKDFLKTLDLPFEEINIEEDDSNFQKVIDLGFRSVPVVVTENESWSGHQPAKLMKLK